MSKTSHPSRANSSAAAPEYREHGSPQGLASAVGEDIALGHLTHGTHQTQEGVCA
jgi:hypothetical protein